MKECGCPRAFAQIVEGSVMVKVAILFLLASLPFVVRGNVAEVFAKVVKIANCDVQLSIQTEFANNGNDFGKFVSYDLPKELSDEGIVVTLINVENALRRNWIIPPYKDSNL